MAQCCKLAMKSLYLCCSLLALLLFASSVDILEVRAENGGRCYQVMDPDTCNLLSCRQRCLQLKNGNGVCVSNLKEGNYQCVCYINC